MNKRLIYAVIVLIGLGLLAGTFYRRMQARQNLSGQKIEMGVNGMTCSVCTTGLRGFLKKSKYIETLGEIDFVKGEADFTLKPGVTWSPKLEKHFKKLVSNAGYTFRDVEVEDDDD